MTFFFSKLVSNEGFRNVETIKMKSRTFYHKRVNKIFSRFVDVQVCRVIARLEVLASCSFFLLFFSGYFRGEFTKSLSV